MNDEGTCPPADDEELRAKVRDQEILIEELRASLNEAIEQVRTMPFNDHVPFAYLSVNRDWQVLHANTAAADLWEVRREGLIGADLAALLGHGRQAERYYDRYAAAIRENRTVVFETFSPVLNRWLAANVSPSQEGLDVWFIDKTEEVSKVTAFARLWGQMKFLSDNTPDIIVRFDAGLVCIFANRAAWETLGLDQPVGKGLMLMGLSGETADRIGDGLKRVLGTGDPVTAEFEVPRGEDRIHVSWRMIPEPGPRRGIDSILVIGQNITERVEAEATRSALETQLREAQKLEAIGTLSGGIAHDFNNILAVILGNAELALDDVRGSSPIAHNLKNLRTAALRGRDLIRQILTFSRRSNQNRHAVAITPLVRETVKLLRSTIPSTIEITVEAHAAQDSVFADEVQIQQILVNLSTNAAHSMPDGGVLTISITNKSYKQKDHMPEPHFRPGDYVVLSVSDTGHGIDEETRERIFEPFFTTKAAGQGTGMGLAVVWGIVKAHEGAVTVQSNPDRGSTFLVFLPVHEAGEEHTPAPGPGQVKGRGRILFIDDEEQVVRMAHDALSRLGYEVVTVTDPREALNVFFNDGAFDLVITDQTMPGVTGLDLARQMIEKRPGVDIILSTGFSPKANEKTAKDAGIKEFLMKPYTRTELSQTVARVLGRPGKGR